MSKHETPAPPDPNEAPGWRVLDPDGNVVDSGPGVVLEAVAASGETDDTDEEK